MLDLGRVCQRARVRLNGEELGTLLTPPFQVAVSSLKPSDNRLEVEVTSVAANRIRDLDRRKVPWKNFQDINFVNLAYKPIDAADWPLSDCGLLGPVTLHPVRVSCSPWSSRSASELRIRGLGRRPGCCAACPDQLGLPADVLRLQGDASVSAAENVTFSRDNQCPSDHALAVAWLRLMEPEPQAGTDGSRAARFCLTKPRAIRYPAAMNSSVRIGRRAGVALVLSAWLARTVCGGAGQPEPAAGRPFVHPLFTDNMVVQRDRPVSVWGWTEPAQQVTVRLHDQQATVRAEAHGKWLAKLGPFTAGGPFVLEISGPQNITLTNVLVGDVWICSGQSNMEMGIGGVNDAATEIAQADHPHLRLCTIPKRIAATPQETPGNSPWQVCSPASVAAGGWGGFSAVGYFFGRDLTRDLNVPIGLIHTSWGGTVAEAWTSREALFRMEDFRPAVEQLAQMTADQQDKNLTRDRLMADWYRQNDRGSTEGLGWAAADAATSDWKSMTLPQNWEQAGLPDYDGVVWFRKAVDLATDWNGKEAKLHLGPIDDRDTTWVNGVKVGALDDWSAARDYRVPAGVLKAGRNVIAVRVLDTAGGGGIYGKPDELRLEPAGTAGLDPVPLAGAWHYRESVSLAQAKPVPQTLENNPNVVTVLYNGMIAPLVPFAIQGAIWYQGESNAGRARQYRTLLPTMIADWRSRFGVGDFPFLIVQLANFMEAKADPGESAWAELREAQSLTSQQVPKTGLAVAIDIGDASDIHPKNKQEVGRRLALAAEAIAYGKKVDYSGPLYRTMTREANRIRLRFDHLGRGLVAKGGGPLRGFAIAGADAKFTWAEAVIEGDTVVVRSPQIPEPVAVRYGWADNPVGNLYNQAGLPAPPFRTDGPDRPR